MIDLKYEEDFSPEKRKSNNGLIAAIVIALLIVAVAAWFALTRYNSANNNTSNGASNMASDFNSFVSDIKSDIEDFTSDIGEVTSDIVSDITDQSGLVSGGNSSVPSTQTTNEGVSSVPYGRSAFTVPVQGEIIKKFSQSELLYSKTFGDVRFHSGIDIACKKGTAVSSCADGTVTAIEENGQYGNVVTIDHGNGITAKYSSIADLKIKIGDKVKSGDIIGTVSTIPAECNDPDHLHFEVYKNGVAVEPIKALGLD